MGTPIISRTLLVAVVSSEWRGERTLLLPRAREERKRALWV
jgi:hypothetical protein